MEIVVNSESKVDASISEMRAKAVEGCMKKLTRGLFLANSFIEFVEVEEGFLSELKDFEWNKISKKYGRIRSNRTRQIRAFATEAYTYAISSNDALNPQIRRNVGRSLKNLAKWGLDSTEEIDNVEVDPGW